MLENVKDFKYGYVVSVPPVVGAKRCTVCDTVYPIMGDNITGFHTWCNKAMIAECPFCGSNESEIVGF